MIFYTLLQYYLPINLVYRHIYYYKIVNMSYNNITNKLSNNYN